MTTVVCKTCGLVQTRPRPTREELTAFYAKEYRMLYSGACVPHPSKRKYRKRRAQGRYTDLRPFLKARADVLEVGCATGEFLEILGHDSHITVGLELSPHCAQISREFCEQVHIGSVEEREFESEGFDVVCLFHVIEHLESPRSAVCKMASWLRPGGLLYVEVPNVEQPYWGNLDRFFQIAHLYSFSPGTLTALLEISGLCPIWTRQLTHEPFLRVIAQKGEHGGIGTVTWPAQDWRDVRASLRTWRRWWQLRYRWTTLPQRSLAAIRRLAAR